MKERVQKLLSKAGVCSRRAAEELIVNGRVKVNNLTVSLGDVADLSTDTITVDDKIIDISGSKIYIMLNKPRGYVTTLSDEAGRKCVTDLISDIEERVYPIGRLDMHSEGLLLMTNDGELANMLTHPKHQVYKKYLVKVTYDDGIPKESPEVSLSKAITIDGIKLLPAKCRVIEQLSDNQYILTIAIREGKNRQIRRMCVSCGYTVNSLKRVAVGNVLLGDLPVGTWRHLTSEEVEYLKSLKI